MKKKYSYIGIAFVILLFGIYTVPKVVDRFQTKSELSFLYTDAVNPEKEKYQPLNLQIKMEIQLQIARMTVKYML